jgi:hypothetical protein
VHHASKEREKKKSEDLLYVRASADVISRRCTSAVVVRERRQKTKRKDVAEQVEYVLAAMEMHGPCPFRSLRSVRK